MIDEKFVQSQKKVVELRILELESELSEYGKYSEMGNSDDENVQEFEVFEEKLALAKNAQKELSELKKVLARIERGTYGKCEICGGDIETGRLKAYLAAKTCVTHAK
jgi:RNA polymerase-binding transcription factor DksA